MVHTIFVARQLQDICQEQNMDLYITFVDLTKAFDTVSREGLWKTMAKFSCPDQFIIMHMVHQLLEGMMACVQNNGETASIPFPVTIGVKQGCKLAPTLFSMILSGMLYDASRETEEGIKIRHRSNGKLFNQRHLKAVPKVKESSDFGWLQANVWEHRDISLNTN